jgi:hypothetical protein
VPQGFASLASWILSVKDTRARLRAAGFTEPIEDDDDDDDDGGDGGGATSAVSDAAAGDAGNIAARDKNSGGDTADTPTKERNFLMQRVLTRLFSFVSELITGRDLQDTYADPSSLMTTVTMSAVTMKEAVQAWLRQLFTTDPIFWSFCFWLFGFRTARLIPRASQLTAIDRIATCACLVLGWSILKFFI